MWGQRTLMPWRMPSCRIHRAAGVASRREDGWEGVVCPQGVGLMEQRLGGRVHRLCTRVRKTPRMTACSSLEGTPLNPYWKGALGPGYRLASLIRKGPSPLCPLRRLMPLGKK